MSDAAVSAVFALAGFNKTLRNVGDVPKKQGKPRAVKVRIKICDVLTGYKLAALYRSKMYFLEELYGSYQEADAAAVRVRREARSGKLKELLEV